MTRVPIERDEFVMQQQGGSVAKKSDPFLSCDQWSSKVQEQRKGAALPSSTRAATATCGAAPHRLSLPKQEEQIYVQLRPLHPPGEGESATGDHAEKDEYGQVLRLTHRFFTPASHAFAALHSRLGVAVSEAENAFVVVGIEKIVLAGALTSSSAAGQAHRATTAAAQPLGGESLLVRKFTSSFTIEELLRTRRPLPTVGPAGLGFYFPNTYDSAASKTHRAVGRDSTITDKPSEHMLLLCEVSCGRMSMGKGSAAPEEFLRRYQADCSAGGVDDGEALRRAAGQLQSKGGFGSMSVAVDGTPHIVVFDPDAVRPLYVVRVKTRSSTVEGLPLHPLDAAVTAVDSVDDEARRRAADTLAAAQKRREAAAAARTTAAAKIRQGCKDLIEAVCVKREEMLAALGALARPPSPLTADIDFDDASASLSVADDAVVALADIMTRVASLRLTGKKAAMGRLRPGTGGSSLTQPSLGTPPLPRPAGAASVSGQRDDEAAPSSDPPRWFSSPAASGAGRLAPAEVVSASAVAAKEPVPRGDLSSQGRQQPLREGPAAPLAKVSGARPSTSPSVGNVGSLRAVKQPQSTRLT